MIEEAAVVVAVRGDLAQVESRRLAPCGGCSANGACGTSLLGRYFGRKRPLLTVHNPIGASPGDSVVVGVPESALLEASFAAYLVPLLAMIGGGIGGGFLAGSIAPAYAQGLSVLGGVGGFAAGLWWLARFSRAREADGRHRAVILRRSGSAGFEVRIPQRTLQGKEQPDRA